MSDPVPQRRVPTTTPWNPQRAAQAAKLLRSATPEQFLAWASESFAPDLCLATSFGPQSIVLMHQISRVCPEVEVFYLDTGLLFDETYALRDRLAKRLGLKFTRLATTMTLEQQEAQFGPELWARDPDRCCRLRKVFPLQRFLASKRAWITGIRNGHSPSRAAVQRVEWDHRNRLVKLNPLCDWTSDRVWAHIRQHRLPVNPLHRRGYPSIGCRPCTRPVCPGSDPRSGRWPGFEKTECGIHDHSGRSE